MFPAICQFYGCQVTNVEIVNQMTLMRKLIYLYQILAVC